MPESAVFHDTVETMPESLFSLSIRAHSRLLKLFALAGRNLLRKRL